MVDWTLIFVEFFQFLSISRWIHIFHGDHRSFFGYNKTLDFPSRSARNDCVPEHTFLNFIPGLAPDLRLFLTRYFSNPAPERFFRVDRDGSLLSANFSKCLRKAYSTSNRRPGKVCRTGLANRKRAKRGRRSNRKTARRVNPWVRNFR